MNINNNKQQQKMNISGASIALPPWCVSVFCEGVIQSETACLPAKALFNEWLHVYNDLRRINTRIMKLSVSSFGIVYHKRRRIARKKIYVYMYHRNGVNNERWHTELHSNVLNYRVWMNHNNVAACVFSFFFFYFSFHFLCCVLWL